MILILIEPWGHRNTVGSRGRFGGAVRALDIMQL
jgi:hypothetical protein